MGKQLNVLIVEDSTDDALILIDNLRRGGYDSVCERVDTAVDMRRALEEKAWDLVVAGYSMPHFDGLSALNLLKEKEKETPFIILSGTIGEDAAVDAMKAGASDYVMKDRPARLVSAIERALGEAEAKRKQAQAEEALQESESRYRKTLDSMGDPIHVVDRSLRITLMNETFKNWNKELGIEAEAIGKTLFEFFSFLPSKVRDEYDYVFEVDDESG